MISEFNSKIIKSLCLLLLVQGCAYFNTFYNAQEHYKDAEKIRIENFGNQLPSRAIQEYEKAIEKSQKVLTDYSDSKYVNDALLLKGKSHFFKREYDSAKEAFDKLKESEEAKTADSRITREQIYFQIAELSYEKELYQQASDNYRNVLSNTISMSRVKESNLKIIQTYRLLGDLDKAKSRIEQLLLDENFNSIKGELNLELAKIELDKNNLDFAIEGLDQVAQNNLNTEISVEAYYLLGNIFLRNPNLDFDRANFFINEGMKQNFNSPYKVIMSKRRDSVSKLIKLKSSLDEESVVNPSTLYAIAEILAFDVGSEYEALDYFEIIIANHSSSEYYAKSLFASYLIYDSKNALESGKYKDIILTQYPQSDYAKKIIDNEKLLLEHQPSKLLLKAESLWSTNKKEAIDTYKLILESGSSTALSAVAAYFLAYYYDYKLSDKDSAITWQLLLVIRLIIC